MRQPCRSINWRLRASELCSRYGVLLTLSELGRATEARRPPRPSAPASAPCRTSRSWSWIWSETPLAGGLSFRGAGVHGDVVWGRREPSNMITKDEQGPKGAVQGRQEVDAAELRSKLPRHPPQVCLASLALTLRATALR